MDSVEHFQRRLEETRAWCTSQDWAARPAEGLRTAHLRPPELLSMEDMVFKKDASQREEIVENLSSRRIGLLQSLDITSPQLMIPLTSGRLLAFNLEQNLTDGAAELVTKGWFDESNIPPWDTWILYVRDDEFNGENWWSPYHSYLLSWVPELLVDLVQNAIDVNPEACIVWATSLDTAFLGHLKQAGLVR